MAWIRCSLSFSLLRSSIQCIRGARSTIGHAVKQPIPPLANFELHMCFQTVTHFYLFLDIFVVHLLLCYTFTIAYIGILFHRKTKTKKKTRIGSSSPPRSPPPTPLMCTITVAAFLAYTGNSYHALHRLAFNTFSCTLFRCDIG